MKSEIQNPKSRILILNGPNLNRLGTREPETYGTTTLTELQDGLRRAFPEAALDFFQSNHEGALIDRLHRAFDEGARGVVLNAGGFAHTSVALRDAVAAIGVPVVEVHLSNVHAREDFRRRSLLAPVCAGQITGLGPAGYHLAVRYFLENAS